MSGSGEDVTKLFRSLKPDDFNVQASANAAAREAEQRWPLLKASAPQKYDLPPELSDQEKQRWGQQKKLTVEHRKPALSLPTSSEKMALSLEKMAGRKPVPTHPETTTASRTSPSALRDGNANTSTTAPVQAPAVARYESDRHIVEPQVKQNVFFSGAKAAVQEAKQDNPLVGIFRRLAGKKEADEAPVTIKPSLFGRLGRR